MGNGILSSIGIDPEILVLILFVLFIICLVMLISLLSKYNKLNASYNFFMRGREAASLEEEIGALFNDISSLKASAEKNRKDIKKMIENLHECYQRVGIVKYDAYKEMGGKLSFSIALINDNKTGFIINTIHSTNGCYVYTKEIVEGECAITLGEEEKKALMLALSDEAYVYD